MHEWNENTYRITRTMHAHESANIINVLSYVCLGWAVILVWCILQVFVWIGYCFDEI